jgi:cyanate lyase
MYSRLIDAEAFLARCAAADLTLKELAERSLLSESMVKKVCYGRRQLADHAAHRVAKVLGCHPNDFSVPKPVDRPPAPNPDLSDCEAA